MEFQFLAFNCPLNRSYTHIQTIYKNRTTLRVLFSFQTVQQKVNKTKKNRVFSSWICLYIRRSTVREKKIVIRFSVGLFALPLTPSNQQKSFIVLGIVFSWVHFDLVPYASQFTYDLIDKVDLTHYSELARFHAGYIFYCAQASLDMLPASIMRDKPSNWLRNHRHIATTSTKAKCTT